MSSPSSSSSSSPTTCTVTCILSGILRRMLCSRTLPTHPADHIAESSSITASEGLENGAKNVPPSVVAKLMGLDSMPNVISSSSTTTTNTPSSITRSRSMNSIDYSEGKSEHSILKSTLSFREIPGPMPSFFEIENEEFFVLSFEHGSEKKDRRLKERKCEKGIGELKQRSEKSCASWEIVEFSTPKRKKKVKIMELECSSEEESSPVSVLDFDQFISQHEVPTSDSLESNSRGKLSPEPENYECLDDMKTRKAEGKCVGSRKVGCSNHNYLDMSDQVCRIAEAEILESNWLCGRNIFNHEDFFEDIYADFESQILDQLLNELPHPL